MLAPGGGWRPRRRDRGAAADELLEIAGKARRAFAPLEAEAQLPRRQLEVLLALYRHEDWTLKQIATHLGLARPTVSLAMAELQEAGLVRHEQDAEDARRRRRALTGEGKQRAEFLLDGYIDQKR
jgi:DNA-binding MarR family transcriptional regulator